jgi:hypothetical protein
MSFQKLIAFYHIIRQYGSLAWYTKNVQKKYKTKSSPNRAERGKKCHKKRKPWRMPKGLFGIVWLEERKVKGSRSGEMRNPFPEFATPSMHLRRAAPPNDKSAIGRLVSFFQVSWTVSCHVQKAKHEQTRSANVGR